ncbi:TIM-barrel domain-containing protein [Nonomuraea sp. MTCD27]|uniref:TIM-barrel domain-containing protein n=1 Tax=Nonomuraea sp. MTCD27 TaxID=1676747 RepID=UPI0035BF3682
MFPDPKGMLRRLEERGLRVCLWINPCIGQASALVEEGAAAGHLLRRADGTVWQDDRWQAGRALVDFTSPAARDWYAGKLRGLLDMGVDAFKTDFGERIPTDVGYADGSDPERMHNYYSLLYNQTVHDVPAERRGPGEVALFEAMAESLRGGLSPGLAGFGFWSHDIGGFEAVHELPDGAARTVTVPSPGPSPVPSPVPALGGGAAAVFEVSREGDRLSARRLAGTPAPWNLRHAGTNAAAAPETDHIEIIVSAKE